MGHCFPSKQTEAAPCWHPRHKWSLLDTRIRREATEQPPLYPAGHRCCYSWHKKSQKCIVLNACKGWSEGAHTHYNLNVDEKPGCRRGTGSKFSVLEISGQLLTQADSPRTHCLQVTRQIPLPSTHQTCSVSYHAACLACSSIFNMHL